MDSALRERANNRCEYCRIHQQHDPFYGFPVDHVIARQHGGPTALDNLCLICFRCNSHKGPNIASIDPATGELTNLFHPRNDQWEEHFQWHNALLVGLTPRGRATVKLLVINHPDYVLLREALIEEGEFPT